MDKDQDKSLVAQNILLNNPCINSQVLTEVANVCKRKFGYTKNQVLNLWQDLLSDCNCVQISKTTFDTAIAVAKKYDFQIFDALIVASALETGCSILYSEDMQHKMMIEKRLTIINPFLV